MKKNDNSILWIGLIAIGVYVYFKNKKTTIVTNTITTTPDISLTNSPRNYTDANLESYNIKYVLSGINKLNKVPNTI